MDTNELKIGGIYTQKSYVGEDRMKSALYITDKKDNYVEYAYINDPSATPKWVPINLVINKWIELTQEELKHGNS